jgi:hypothetical protein
VRGWVGWRVGARNRIGRGEGGRGGDVCVCVSACCAPAHTSCCDLDVHMTCPSPSLLFNPPDSVSPPFHLPSRTKTPPPLEWLPSPTHHTNEQTNKQNQAHVSEEMMGAILTVADGDMRKAVTTLQSAHQVGTSHAQHAGRGLDG